MRGLRKHKYSVNVISVFKQHAALKQLPADSKYCKRDCFSRHQSCSEEDAEDSFAVDNFVMQLTSNIDSEEKLKILSFLAIRSKAENEYFLRFERIFSVDMSTKPNQLLESLLAMQQFSFCNWPMQPADVLAF